MPDLPVKPPAPQLADPELADAFRNAFRRHPAGVAVIAARAGETPVALTVSSLISVSAAPPIVAFSLSARSSSAGAILAAETMVIHMLRYDDLDLAQLGAASGADRFDGTIPWEFLPTGEPRYTTVQTWFRARRLGTLPVEGAVLVAAELMEGEAPPVEESGEAEPLIYLDRRWHRLREKLGGMR